MPKLRKTIGSDVQESGELVDYSMMREDRYDNSSIYCHTASGIAIPIIVQGDAFGDVHYYDPDEDRMCHGAPRAIIGIEAPNPVPARERAYGILTFCGWHALIPDRVKYVIIAHASQGTAIDGELRPDDIILYDDTGTISPKTGEGGEVEHLHLERDDLSQLCDASSLVPYTGQNLIEYRMKSSRVDLPDERFDDAVRMLEHLLLARIHWTLPVNPSEADAKKIVSDLSFGYVQMPEWIGEELMRLSETGYFLNEPTLACLIDAIELDRLDEIKRQRVTDLISFVRSYDDLIQLWSNVLFEGNFDEMMTYITMAREDTASVLEAGESVNMEEAARARYEKNIPTSDLFGCSAKPVSGEWRAVLCSINTLLDA